jgi:hypothetical protein
MVTFLSYPLYITHTVPLGYILTSWALSKDAEYDVDFININLIWLQNVPHFCFLKKETCDFGTVVI